MPFDNPFLPMTDFLPARFLQVYVVLMALAVVVGTVFDLYHKRSAKFFAEERARARAAATRPVAGSPLAAIVGKTLAHDVATFGEFSNVKRRISHALMFYGFVLYLVTTVILVFGYPGDPDTPDIVPLLWNVGALMVMVGGYGLFFFLRANVVHLPWHLGRANIFIVSLLASVTFALVYELVALAESLTATRIAFTIYLAFTTLLFVSVPWSKFAHMLYKSVMAFEQRVQQEDGSGDLPAAARRHQG